MLTLLSQQEISKSADESWGKLAFLEYMYVFLCLNILSLEQPRKVAIDKGKFKEIKIFLRRFNEVIYCKFINLQEILRR